MSGIALEVGGGKLLEPVLGQVDFKVRSARDLEQYFIRIPVLRRNILLNPFEKRLEKFSVPALQLSVKTYSES